MLKDKIAIVTGGARGIGRAVAFNMASYGAKIALFDLNEKGLKETAEQINAGGGNAIYCITDVSKKENCEASVQRTVEKFGTVDILANCAGISHAGRLDELVERDWDKVMDINLKGTFFLSQLVSKIMIEKGYGKIVNTASQAAKVGEAGNGVYCISKAGIVMMTQVMALELAEYGINVNAVCPGYTDTAIMQQVFLERGPLLGMTPEECKKDFLENVPLKRMARPDEIGELMSFLASDKSSYITGVAISIAGGKILF
ncbi:SDR family NAD(P)-dependent oxidoreductase [Christensenella hongkongensis]|uniref:3-oxoacyl-[acyl-carrier protein] reductase n=1 Tax=Christensenella hongkongensis TaxID=270498 RepID=A0A0M2NJP7_9FIRM|nr:SDR family NAD(P)-dependent oxidoreductase [Christensenella hongkongensis]KKI50657.1 3-oxoacyl-[acyl-carrier protein] reductase [Christensenella hongkongensis]TCW27038.1 3-oxoacyl-[acyl-carrier protein] reductase/2-hydroxycyclohexanecarboxyl-CoA dehydrogenase [Christensenella hongkongensis]